MASKKVYLSESGFISYIDRANEKHSYAKAYFRYFGQEGYLLFTDIVTIILTYNRIYKDISPSLAKDFLRTVSLSNINIIYPEESDSKAALKTLVNYQSTDLTYSEALMAVLANRRDIKYICTFDYLHPLFGISAFYLPI